MSYLRKLPREAPAGTRLLYSTGETNLVGVLLRRATKKDAGDLSLGEDLGAGGHGAAGHLDPRARAATRSAAAASRRRRATSPGFGVFILNGARRRRAEHRARRLARRCDDRARRIGRPGRGYGYQWWTYDDGTFAARGIFGQGIFIDPKRKVVIVSNANWGGGATDRVASEAREAFYRTVLKAVDDEAAGAAGAPAKP